MSDPKPNIPQEWDPMFQQCERISGEIRSEVREIRSMLEQQALSQAAFLERLQQAQSDFMEAIDAEIGYCRGPDGKPGIKPRLDAIERAAATDSRVNITGHGITGISTMSLLLVWLWLKSKLFPS